VADAVEKAYRAIQSGITSGRLAGGAHIKGEDLAAQLGISRTPVREALRRLHSEGMVDFVANRGAFVTTWTRADVDEMFGLRAVLESYAAELAARRLTAAQLDELERLAEQTRLLAELHSPGALDAIAEANARFHRLIVDAAAHPRLAAMIGSVVQMPLVMRTFHVYTDADLVRSAHHHAELVAAFGARDPHWAASVMRSHILAAHHVVLAAYDRTD
jgi:DNA-binding GntR family transcriptional regulator